MVYDPRTGAVQCPKCGAENEFEAPYCAKCGFPLKKYARPDRERWTPVILISILLLVLVPLGWMVYDNIIKHIFPREVYPWLSTPVGILIGMGIVLIAFFILGAAGLLPQE